MEDKVFDLENVKEKIIENLKKVYDPEIPANIFDLGLIYNIEFDINIIYDRLPLDIILQIKK